MDARTLHVMGHDPYSLLLPLSVGEAVGRYLKHQHPTHTAKEVARKADLDVRTVENILAGHLSGVTITKLIRSYGWDLVTTVGTAVIGQTQEQAINRELEEIAHARRALDEAEGRSRSAWEALRARRSVGDSGLRLVAENDLEPVRQDGREGRGMGLKETR